MMKRFFAILLMLIVTCAHADEDEPRLLIKFATRERPEQLFTTLDAYYQRLSGSANCTFLISCDEHDVAMNNSDVIMRLQQYSNLKTIFGPYKSPVQLLNRDVDQVDFDVVLIASDDSAPLVDGFDHIIVDQMREHFPDFDGIINLGEGHTDVSANTMPIVGKNWFHHIGYVFYPAYTEYYHDCELTIVARMLYKEFLYEPPLIRHKKSVAPKQRKRRASHNAKEPDATNTVDYALFCARQQSFFDIDESTIRAATRKDWSILICTIYDRQELFERIYTKLCQQIAALDLEDRVEILYFLDERGQHSIGYKRNWLLQHSNGFYVNHIDDDDDVADNYIKMIYEKLEENADFVRVAGRMISVNGTVRPFVHALNCKTCSRKKDIDYRIPIHLNTMKRYIAVQTTFPEINRGEDYSWGFELVRLNLYKTEAIIDTPYYFYLPSSVHERRMRRKDGFYEKALRQCKSKVLK